MSKDIKIGQDEAEEIVEIFNKGLKKLKNTNKIFVFKENLMQGKY